MTSPGQAAPGSRTIERTFRVLDSFATAGQEWRTTSLARHCGLPVPTMHRILRVLERFAYIRRDPESGAYSLGPASARLMHEEPLLTRLRADVLPALCPLQSATGERISLAALSRSRDHGFEVLAVDSISAGPPRQEAAPEARVTPLHAGAQSKVLLAQLSGEELGRVIARGLDSVGPGTVTRPKRLRNEVAAIRRRGWAFSREELVANRWALAVPVPTKVQMSFALGVSAPLDRFDRDRARRHLSVLDVGARALAARLENSGPEPVASSDENRRRGVPRSGLRDDSAGADVPSPQRGERRWQMA